MNDKQADAHILGMSKTITRRDFLNAALLGTGAALITQAAPALAS